jgi:hypothetical protein
MNEKQLNDAEQLYQNWSDRELVRATTVEKQDYESSALALMARELSRRGTSQSERESVEKEVIEQVESEQRHLTGIRGLLLLFVILVVVGSVFNAASGVALLMASMRDGNVTLMLSSVLSLIFSGYGFFVFYLLIRKRSTAPKHAQRLLIFGFLITILGVLAAWVLTHRLDLGLLLFGCISLSFSLGYLSSSRRVANTYGPPQEDGVSSRNDHSTGTK